MHFLLIFCLAFYFCCFFVTLSQTRPTCTFHLLLMAFTNLIKMSDVWHPLILTLAQMWWWGGGGSIFPLSISCLGFHQLQTFYFKCNGIPEALANFSPHSFKLRKNIPVLVSTTHRKPEYLSAYYCLRSNNSGHRPSRHLAFDTLPPTHPV